MRRRRGPWHPPTLADTVRGELEKLGPDATLGPIVQAWPDAVGEAVATNAWPARFRRDGALVVHASSSVWAFELTALEATIRERLEASLGDAAPAKLVFAQGRIPEPGPAPEAAAETPPAAPSQAERAEAEALVSGIESEALREAVAKAAAASLAARSHRQDDRQL
jgi:hypothetical protein